jgi:hypothetical protein
MSDEGVTSLTTLDRLLGVDDGGGIACNTFFTIVTS